MRVPIDQIGSPTYAPNLVDVIMELVAGDQRGVFHVAGSELMDRYAFACLAADTFRLDKARLLPVTTPELRQRAARPLRAGMRIDKVRSVVTTPLVDPADGLRRMRDESDRWSRS
jgi:dTDP-4-dehydrorhamnose reductase